MRCSLFCGRRPLKGGVRGGNNGAGREIRASRAVLGIPVPVLGAGRAFRSSGISGVAPIRARPFYMMGEEPPPLSESVCGGKRVSNSR